jgi:hypothetical protein
MGQLSTRTRRLRDDLHQLLDAPRPTQLEIDRLRDRVADLLLRARTGQPVTRGQLKEAGIHYPTQVKNRLLSKLRAAGIELQIASSAGLYTLPTSEP